MDDREASSSPKGLTQYGTCGRLELPLGTKAIMPPQRKPNYNMEKSFEQFKEEFLETRSYIACDEEVLKQAYEESHGNIDLATDFILSQDLADEIVL